MKKFASPLAIVVCGGIIIGLALGMRHVQGLFMLPMTAARGWGRQEFAFALALQNLVWGLAQPLAGMLADRYGARRMLVAGCLAYAAGLLLMAQATTAGQLAWSGGVLIGLALAGTTFGVVYGAISRLVAPQRRSWALGMAGAIGGVGQFAMVPATQGLIGGIGWAAALAAFAVVLALALPLAWPLEDRAVAAPERQAQSMRQAIREALSHRGFWLLNLGFLACGFQLAFIAAHFPAWLLDRGFPPHTGVAALAIVALANVAGTYACGQLGSLYRRKHLLAGLYLVRSGAMLAFMLLPASSATVYLFSFVMGLTWLGTVPLTNGLVSQVFGVQYIATLFGLVFVGHQVGGFLGVWLGGAVFDATHSYDLVWSAAILVGLAAAALHWPIDDRAVARLRAA
ncbi:MFS transporter [Pseudoduganella buxea]|uniref:MFS transporter n=1 Tax=Pseudoduganella buxea TaxID=1949069 RepID=A0A6I3STJ6_9BURK|nr:MFS transporter [Pseudoduganella buxea]MTV52451.1 MFS transporter [Pseudoduganella buxea]GGC18280.1 MFS transporter [Pseudoduganella buxea]